MKPRDVILSELNEAYEKQDEKMALEIVMNVLLDVRDLLKKNKSE